MAARSVGMRVEKFYIGYNLFGLGIKKTYKGTEYGIGLFPLGGYVKVAGVLDESLDPSTTGAPDEFNSKSPLQKIWFLSAGVIMNVLLAFLIFSFITLNLGIGKVEDGTKIESVENRVVIFDSQIRHAGVPCTDEKRRVVINFNFIGLT